MNGSAAPLKRKRVNQVRRKTAQTWFVCAVLLTGLSFLVACAPPGGVNPSAQSAGASPEKFSHLDPDEKVAMADLLTDEGEQLLGFTTLNDAWGKFSEALQANPGNERARLWKELLRPLFEMKGIYARVKPLYMKNGGAARYQKLLEIATQDSTPEYRRFLTEGPNDIDTDAKFREWVDRGIVTLDNLRNYLNANKDRSYSLRAPVHFISGKKASKPEDAGRCTALKIMASTFSGCAESGMLKFKVNRADLELIQLGVALQMINYSVFYAFNVNPSAVFEGGAGLNQREFIERVMKGYDGSLFEQNRLNLANSVSTDWLAAQTYFFRNQDSLCKHGRWDEANRKGFLISSGVCLNIDGSLQKTNGELRMLELLVAGQPIEIAQAHLERPTSIHALKFFNSPPKNITPFMPTSFDPNGEAIAFNDSAYSPYFAQGSMTDIARAVSIERAEKDEKTRREREAYANPQPPTPPSSGETNTDSNAGASREPSAAGAITGFRFTSCEAALCITVEAPKAWLSQTNGAFVAADGVLKILKDGKVTRELRGTEIVSQPEIDMITVEAGETVTMVNLKNASLEVYGGSR